MALLAEDVCQQPRRGREIMPEIMKTKVLPNISVDSFTNLLNSFEDSKESSSKCRTRTRK